MRFETKIAIVVREDLEAWQKLNVTAFLASGIAFAEPETRGEPYRDASDVLYAALFRQPVTVLTGDAATLKETFSRALGRALRLAVYTDAMFATAHDADNRAAVAAVATDALSLAGFAAYGPRNAIDRALKGLRLHA
jgi:hypothetical protein